MNTLIFDSTIKGHHLEYLHHLYMGAKKRKDHYVILVPKDFETEKDKLLWPPSENIEFVYLDFQEEQLCNHPNLLKRAFYSCRIINRYIKNYKIDKIFLLILMQSMPFLPFMIPSRILIEGIIYRIYLYSHFRKVRLWLESLRFMLLSRSTKFSRVFVLNDREAVNILNARFRTNHFQYLPDPVPVVNILNIPDIRYDFVKDENDIFFLHFGEMTERKGTIEILKAIQSMTQKELKGKIFVFAGIITKDIAIEFERIKKEVEKKAEIFVYNEFCSYSFINSLCKSCDVILTPYSNINQSSGVIGHAAFFRKPIIGPSEGLLGRLIIEYNLGMTLNDTSASSIREAICKFRKYQTNSEYADSHSVNEFTNICLG